jgi:hypothetical protein
MEGKMNEKQEFLTTRQLTEDEIKAITKISDDFFTVFSNQVRVAASATEFRLFFGENYPTATGEIKIIENLSVVLTPIQAKLLASNLFGVIQKLEAADGQIPVLQVVPTAEPAAATPAQLSTSDEK